MQVTKAPTRPCASIKSTSSKRVPAKVQVQEVGRRQLLASTGGLVAGLLGAAGAAVAAGESSATRAITAVNRPQQMKKKEENKAALKEKVQKVREGKADPSSIP